MSQKIRLSMSMSTCVCAFAAAAFGGTDGDSTLSMRATAINGITVFPDPGEVIVTPGDVLTVELFLDAWAPHAMRAYQVTLDPASLSSASAGTLEVLSDDSLIDTTRGDFAFAGLSTDPADEEAFALVDNQSGLRWGAGLFETAQGIPDPGMPVYVGTLTVVVSHDAAGTFAVGLSSEQTFLRNSATPPGEIPITIQSLSVGIGACSMLTDCGDLDDNGVRDEACQWYACEAGTCTMTPRVTQADLGGPNGQCPPDQACDGNDRFHALNCFANRSTAGDMFYPCEPAPPGAVNVDAGGPGVGCALDGVCDANDAFHALNCFADINSSGTAPYLCACGPNPNPPAGSHDLRIAARTGLSLRGPANVHAGEMLEVDVYTNDPLKALRGYQLHTGVRGGRGSTLELVDIVVHGRRADHAFARQRGAWTAMNRDIQQLAVGVDAVEGMPAPAAAYLATFVYRVPPQARGTFIVDLRYSKDGSNAAERTFLFGRYGRPIQVSAVEPALITVRPRLRSAP